MAEPRAMPAVGHHGDAGVGEVGGTGARRHVVVGAEQLAEHREPPPDGGDVDIVDEGAGDQAGCGRRVVQEPAHGVEVEAVGGERGGEEAAAALLDGLCQQRVPGTEVAVDEALVHPGVAGDVAHRDRGRPSLGEQLDGRPQQRITCRRRRVQGGHGEQVCGREVARSQPGLGRSGKVEEAPRPAGDGGVAAAGRQRPQPGRRDEEALERHEAEDQAGRGVGAEPGTPVGPEVTGGRGGGRRGLGQEPVDAEAGRELTGREVAQGAADEQLHAGAVRAGRAQQVEHGVVRGGRGVVDDPGGPNGEPRRHGADEAVLGAVVAGDQRMGEPGGGAHVPQ